MTDAFYSMLGLCMRAGKLVSGEEACIQAIRSGQAKLAVLDGSASANSRKAVGDACSFRGVPLVVTEPGRFGQAVGKSGRKAGVVTEAGFAKALREKAGEIARQIDTPYGQTIGVCGETQSDEHSSDLGGA